MSVLRGGVVFLADLVRAAAMPCRVDFMAISRFDASEDTGVVRIEKDLDLDLSGAHVLVVEDIVDTGLTLTYLLRVLAARGPASLRVCALLDKRARRIVDVPLSYVGFEVPDVFLVGYGLDLDERERGGASCWPSTTWRRCAPTRPCSTFRPGQMAVTAASGVNGSRLQPSLGMSHRLGASDSLGQCGKRPAGRQERSTPEGVSRWSN